MNIAVENNSINFPEDNVPFNPKLEYILKIDKNFRQTSFLNNLIDNLKYDGLDVDVITESYFNIFEGMNTYGHFELDNTLYSSYKILSVNFNNSPRLEKITEERELTINEFLLNLANFSQEKICKTLNESKFRIKNYKKKSPSKIVQPNLPFIS